MCSPWLRLWSLSIESSPLSDYLERTTHSASREFSLFSFILSIWVLARIVITVTLMALMTAPDSPAIQKRWMWWYGLVQRRPATASVIQGPILPPSRNEESTVSWCVVRWSSWEDAVFHIVAHNEVEQKGRGGTWCIMCVKRSLFLFSNTSLTWKVREETRIT